MNRRWCNPFPDGPRGACRNRLAILFPTPIEIIRLYISVADRGQALSSGARFLITDTDLLRETGRSGSGEISFVNRFRSKPSANTPGPPI